MGRQSSVADPADDLVTGEGEGAPEADARLVRLMIEGSEEALAGLYDRHGTAVFGAAMRASRDRWIAAEVVQETFLALWNRAELFDPSRGTLPAWLQRIARNRAVDHLRAAARHGRAAAFSSLGGAGTDQDSMDDWLLASGELIGMADVEPGPEVALSTKETRASIEEALGSLDPVERRVIVLAYDGGLSQSEIAASLGWPIGTVKTRTRRALRHLRDRLDSPHAGAKSQASRERRDTPESVRSMHTRRPAPRFGDCLAPC